jgi:hypothetical protein
MKITAILALILLAAATTAAAATAATAAALKITALRNADGTLGLAAAADADAGTALTQPAPLRATIWDGAPATTAPAAEPATLQAGYATLRETAPGEWLGTGTLKIAAGATLEFSDRWTTTADTLRLRREVRVRAAADAAGAAAGGFTSVIALQIAGAKPWPEMEWFVPGTIYGNFDYLRDNSFGAGNYYKPGDYTVWIREDRLPAPLLATRLPGGAIAAVLDSAPDGTTTAVEGWSFSREPLADECFRFGAILAEERPAPTLGAPSFHSADGDNAAAPSPAAHAHASPSSSAAAHAAAGTVTSLGYAFPGSEGTLSYGRKTGRGPETEHRWRHRYHPLKDGLVQRYEVSFLLGDAKGLNELVSRSWRWAWDALRPQTNPQDLETLRACMADVLAENTLECDDRAGPLWLATAVDAPTDADHALAHKSPKAVLGFTGYAIGTAEMLLAEAGRDPTPRGARLRALAEKIMDTFLRLPMSPPRYEGFFLKTGAPATTMAWGGRAPTEKDAIYLRCFCDDLKSLLRAHARETRAGRDHPEWMAWARQFADWLLTQELPGGGFPRSWHAFTGEPYSTSATGSFNAVAFLARLYHATNHRPYLDAALRAGEFAWHDAQHKGRFIGGTIDNPNVIDKEAATNSLEGYLALYTTTRDKKWLARAEAAATAAESWMYIWNVPMPADAADAQLRWKRGHSTVGIQLIATSHSLNDAYMAFNVESYARLSRETGDPHYMEVARILLHNTKAMVARPGDLRGLRGPGWQQEHWCFAIPRGLDRHQEWLPWVTVSQLRGINDLIDYDPELYRQLANPGR